MKKVLAVLFKTIRYIVKTVLLLFAVFLIWWLIFIPIANNIILNGYVKELRKGLLDEYNRYRTEAMLAALEEPESLEGYYILFSLYSAAWDSFLTWDIRAH